MHLEKQGSSKSHDTTYHLDLRNGGKLCIVSGCHAWLWLGRRSIIADINKVYLDKIDHNKAIKEISSRSQPN